MYTLEQIKEFEDTYKGNIDTVLYRDRQLMNRQNHDDRMGTVYRRSQTIRRIYLENQELLKNFLSSSSILSIPKRAFEKTRRITVNTLTMHILRIVS